MQTTSVGLARRLRDAGLTWHPRSGDAFCLDLPEFSGEATGQPTEALPEEPVTFTVSDMTIEPHEFDTGTILGFNGTTEWALDSVALEKTLWLPLEGQLRELLGETFASLQRIDGAFVVELVVGGTLARFDAPTAPDAYALALLTLLARPAAV